jgi:hypothetical protein
MVGVVLPSIAKEPFPNFMGSFFNYFFVRLHRSKILLFLVEQLRVGKKCLPHGITTKQINPQGEWS